MGALDVAYQRAGQGPPIVLVHGAGDDSHAWQPQIDGLADEFTVVAWDEPGAGRSSDVPAGFGLADYADCLAALITSLESGPVHLAGVSWGGTVVLELWRRHRALVASLLLLDTYAGWKGSLPPDELRARVEGIRAQLDDGTLPAGVRPQTLRNQLTAMADADLRTVLTTITVPVLLVWGEDDARSPLTIAHQFAEAITRTELIVVAGAGHLSNLDEPDAVNDAIRRFVRRVPDPDSGLSSPANGTIA